MALWCQPCFHPGPQESQKKANAEGFGKFKRNIQIGLLMINFFQTFKVLKSPFFDVAKSAQDAVRKPEVRAMTNLGALFC